MNIKITADSTCDLSEELLRQWNISLMPMHILMGDDTYLDGVTIHPADVFAHVDAGGQPPKSAAANPVEYIDFFESFAKEYDAVIHISVSAKLSSCYQNARLAAQEYDNVSVIDSENICTGQGYLVLRAAKWAADGLTARNICMRVNRGGKMPKSAAANLVEYTEFFAPFAKEYDAVIHISVSSKLSSCFQNARLAAGEFENVCVVDSQNICTGQGYLVLKAAKWAADGLTARAIQMKLQSLARRVELSFVLDRLDFMAKSGRCSGVLAFGANLLGIKPALEVINGELKVVKKYRGSLPICVGKYITDRLADRDDIEDGLVFISSCQPKPGCMDAVKAGLKKYGSFKECHETDIGTTIGGYSGPGTIGIVFARKEK